MKADTLILGKINTLDPRWPLYEACTVKDGVVQFVGSKETALKLCDENTKVLDYGDASIYPGFIEGHCHGLLAGPRLAFFAKVQDGNSYADYCDLMRQYIKDNPDMGHYWGAGWMFRDVNPTAAMLDEVSDEFPICLNSIDGHSMWMNHKALEYFGITRESVKRWGKDIVRVDENGDPSGYISEGPCTEISSKMLALSKEERKKAFLAWQEFALSYGITAYYEAGVTESICQAYRELIDEGLWKIRVYAGWLMDENDPDLIGTAHKAKAAAEKYNCEYFQIIGLKIFMDGVIEAHTGWTLEEYDDQPGYTGVKRFCDFEKTWRLYAEAAKLGFNVHSHCVGDGAVKFAVDCIEKAQLETGKMNMRNAICHLQLVRPEDVIRMCDYNIVAVVAPLWMLREPEYYDQTEAYIGKRRAFFQYPLQSFLKHNGIMAFHTDYPVSPAMSIPQSIYCAQERNNPGMDVYTQLNYHEVISREDALSCMTTGAAYEVFQENRLGCIQIGCPANMTIFDMDLVNDDINEISKAKTVAVIIDGEVVYKS